MKTTTHLVLVQGRSSIKAGTIASCVVAAIACRSVSTVHDTLHRVGAAVLTRASGVAVGDVVTLMGAGVLGQSIVRQAVVTGSAVTGQTIAVVGQAVVGSGVGGLSSSDAIGSTLVLKTLALANAAVGQAGRVGRSVGVVDTVGTSDCIVDLVVVVLVSGSARTGSSSGSSGGSGLVVAVVVTLATINTVLSQAIRVSSITLLLLVVVVVSSSTAGSGSGACSGNFSAIMVVVVVVVMAVLVVVRCETSVLGALIDLVVLIGAAVELLYLVGASKLVLALVELINSHCGKSGGAVVDWLGVVSLVNGHGGVDDVGLDCLLLDDGLDVLMDVVVDTLTGDDRGSVGGVCGLVGSRGVLELRSLAVKSISSLALVAVVESLVLGGDHVMMMLLRTAQLLVNAICRVRFELTESPCA